MACIGRSAGTLPSTCRLPGLSLAPASAGCGWTVAVVTDYGCNPEQDAKGAEHDL